MQALDKKIEEKNKETNEEKINNEFYEEDKKKVEVKEGIDKSLLDIYNNADYENGILLLDYEFVNHKQVEAQEDDVL